MTLNQVKTFIIGVLKGWFTNKFVLDKLSESESGELLYDSKSIGTSGGGSSDEKVTDEEIEQAIVETITELNTESV